MKIASALKASIVIVASFIVTVVAADLAFRAAKYMPPIDDAWLFGPGGRFRIPNESSILIHPKLLTDEYYEIDDALKTVVILGDSFVEGYPVADRDNYPSVLRRQLGDRGRDANVVNMGLGDSGPDQHLRIFKDILLPRLSPDIVVWTFYANDVLNNLQLSTYEIENGSLKPLDGSRHRLYIRHAIFDLIPLPRTIKEGSPVLRLLLRAMDILSGGPPGHGPAERLWSERKIRLAIDEMERLAREHGFVTAYVLIAPQVLYLNEFDPADKLLAFHVSQYQQLRPILAPRARFVDAFFGGTSTMSCGSEIRMPDLPAPAWSTFFDDGSRDNNDLGRRHFNEAGYDLLAEAVATCLMNEKW